VIETPCTSWKIHVKWWFGIQCGHGDSFVYEWVHENNAPFSWNAKTNEKVKGSYLSDLQGTSPGMELPCAELSSMQWTSNSYLIMHHATKTYWGSGGIAPHILNLGNGWRWVFSFTERPLYFRGKIPGTHWIGRWVDPRALVEAVANACRELKILISIMNRKRCSYTNQIR